MPARESEALVLRTYPFQEADLIVSFFTRDQGKLRGVAKGVRRPKSRYGCSLERLAHSRIAYFQKQNVELARIDRAELLGPPLTIKADFGVSLALDFVAEVADELLPDHEPNDAFFRLVALTLEEFWKASTGAEGGDEAVGAAARTATYFALWAVKLGGWLPPLDVCLETGKAIEADEPAWFDRSHHGLLSAEARGAGAWKLTPESRRLAAEMLRKPPSRLDARSWTAQTAADLRLFMNQRLETHIEKRLKTTALLDSVLLGTPVGGSAA